MNIDGEFFWVVLLVLYLIFQVLSGRKKKKTQQRRPEAADRRRSDAPPRRRPQTAAESPGRGTELDEALQEIRRALGFPDERDQGETRDAEVPTRHDREDEEQREAVFRTAEKPVVEGRYESGIDTTTVRERPRPKTTRPLPKPATTPSRLPERPAPKSPPTFARGDVPGAVLESRIAKKSIVDRRGERLPREIGQSSLGRSVRESALKARLRHPQSLREAILLKEILDPPISLRPRR